MFEITIINAGERNRKTDLSLPATSEQVREAFGRIGLDWNGQRGYMIAGRRMTPDGLMECIQPDDRLDNLNYLAARLESLDAAQLASLAAVLDMRHDLTAPAVIDLTYNLEYYVHIPDVANYEDLGRYYLYDSGMVEMPESWKSVIPLEAFGKNAAEQEHGQFTQFGYIAPSDDEWEQRYNGENIPEKYRVTLYPNQPEIHFSIYQIKESDERGLLWMPYDALVKLDRMPRLEDYRFVYSGVMYPGETLETVFEKFNINHPEDYTGRSLSVSDVVVFEQDGHFTAHYVDSVGFRQIDDFLPKEQEREKPPKEKQHRQRDYGPEL